MSCLTGDDLARPAKDLPLKVIRDLGHMLHRAQYNSGNWETIAEDLGYEHEEIKHFNTMANVRQEVVPGELMLRDWVQRFNGRTLFVLHSALTKAERLDCVNYLESEIYKRVVCMELMVCIRHEDCKPTDHLSITTRAESNLLDSLQNVLDQPLPEKYKLLDQGVSWTGTIAREFKGRQLMLLRKSDVAHMEQDPTIDSSGLDMSGMDESGSLTISQSSVPTSSFGTSQNSISTSILRANHTHIVTGSNFHQSYRRVGENEPNNPFRGTVSSNNKLSVMGNFPASHRKVAKIASSSPSMPNRNMSRLSLDQTRLRPTTDRLVLSPDNRGSSGSGNNNLDIVSEKWKLSPSQQTMNISDSDGKIDNVIFCKEYSAAEIGKQNTNNKNIEKEANMARSRMDITETCSENSAEDHRVCTIMECPSSLAVGTDVDDADCEYREFSEYKDPNKYRDFGELYKCNTETSVPVNRHLDNGNDPREMRMTYDTGEVGEYRDFGGIIIEEANITVHKNLDKDANKMRTTKGDGEYNDPCETKYTGQFCEYKDPGECRDGGVHKGSGIYPDNILDESEKRRKLTRDSSEYKDMCEYRDMCIYRDPGEYTDTSEYRDPREYTNTSEHLDTSEYKNPSEYRDPNEYRDPSEYMDPSVYKNPSEHRDSNAYRDPSDTDVRFTSGGFDTADILHAAAEIRQVSVLEVNGDQEITSENPKQKDNAFNIADYQLAAEDFRDVDDSITVVKQNFSSRTTTPSIQNGAHDIESELGCNIQYSASNIDNLSDFDSDSYNAHPVFQRRVDDVNGEHADMNMDGVYNGDVAFIGDSDERINEESEETRIYLDFNKYDQGDANVAMDKFKGSVQNTNTDLGLEKIQSAMGLTSGRIQHQPPRRFVSEVVSQSSSTTRNRKIYETLQRGVSCPSDIVYEKSLVFLEEHDMVTIADVFSPATEESKIKDFETADSGEIKPSVSSESLDNTALSTSKRHSLPMCRPGQNTKRTRLQRHTFQHGDKVVRFDESFEQDHSRTMQGSPQLPPRGRLPPLSSSSSETLSRCGTSDSDISVQSEVQETMATGQTCKIVIGRKSSRPALDGFLADDKLFTHYNTLLCSFPGWSPRETENTIEKTMRDGLSSDGYYILWYIRGRKNLVLSVSFRGTLVHYRVHTKVLTGKLHYYITQGKYFDDIIQLLYHYVRYGVRAPAGKEGGHSRSAEYRIPLRCPVLVQYERRPAVSV